MTALINAADLLHEIDDEDLVVLDVQYTLTGDGPRLYTEGHLPGAPFVDLDTVLAHRSALNADLRDIIETQWIPALEQFKPQMVFVSAGFDAHRCRGQRVIHLVGAEDAELHTLRGPVRGVHGKRRASDGVELYVGGVIVSFRVAGLGERDHPGCRARRHSGHQIVVGVEDRDAICRQRLDELALRDGNVFPRAELPDVGGANIEHHTDLRRRNGG